MSLYFITGTDTDVGKSVACAWLMLHFDFDYWKPIQSGIEGITDINAVKGLTELPDEHFYPETRILTQPLSPHESAKRDDVYIGIDEFKCPKSDNLIIEGAGGVLVPINKDKFVIDMISHLEVPAILVCRSGLGTINHTLLSLEALKKRNIKVAGIIIQGPLTPHNRQAIEEYGQTPIIAEIPHFEALTKENLLSIKPEIDLRAERKAA